MKKSERILFIAALIVCAASLLTAVVSAYFGIYYIVLEKSGGDGLAQAFTAVFFILSTLISWCLSLLSLPLFVLAPLRSEQVSVRRTALVLLCVIGAFFLLNACLLIIII